jgi:hypothetical protein
VSTNQSSPHHATERARGDVWGATECWCDCGRDKRMIPGRLCVGCVRQKCVPPVRPVRRAPLSRHDDLLVATRRRLVATKSGAASIQHRSLINSVIIQFTMNMNGFYVSSHDVVRSECCPFMCIPKKSVYSSLRSLPTVNAYATFYMSMVLYEMNIYNDS